MHKILIVEDDRETQEMYMEYLVKDAYQILTANNGEEGLQKIKKFTPDLVIMDMAMPQCSGREMLSKLRHVNKEVPIIIVSGKKGMKEDPEIKLCPQVRDFLVKPVDLPKLRAKIHEIFGSDNTVESAMPGKNQDTAEIPLPGKSKEVAGVERAQTVPPVAHPAPPEPLAQDPLLDIVLGGCVLESFIGKGGSSRVYKGRHQSLGISVAVKILSSDFCSDQVEVQRFLREGRILAHIDHNNVAKILNMGNERGYHFIIMRYIEGQSLLALLRNEGKLAQATACDFAQQIANGLLAAHKSDIIHRDIKPSNILIEKSTLRAKVIDFGTAKKIHMEQVVTGQGIIIGTPYYMSPEQCLGEELDKRTDVYSLGATLYHMVTSGPPFVCPTILETLAAQVEKPVLPPHQKNSNISSTLSHIILRMLEKKREKRYSSMEEVIAALQLVK
jgi:CheY-like chemotaxis protein/tRNA A-37 threonylcarbamoyl transferase component Bud32